MTKSLLPMSHRTIPSVFLSFVLLAAAVCADEPVADDTQHVEFFETKIRPLLVNQCYECHSGVSKSLKAGLRLDSKSAMLKGGDSGPAIVPGKPTDSLLIQSVRYESNEMPPNGKLGDAQIAALTKWVELGAPWPQDAPVTPTSGNKGYDWDEAAKHWAFQPVQKVMPPVADDNPNQHPIDLFITARLQDKGLTQTAPAPAAVFVRRAFFDLIGLPPTPDQLEHWVERLHGETHLNDAAVAQLIDTLLQRPQYGERWGRHWLDVARYSDIGGWSQDNKPHPSSWQYRDWVVEAINADMPYDEFVRCQIVGDKIDKQSAAGTGFFALGPTYASDGGDPESVAQAKGETLDDRVDTFSRAFLGLTVACARCHDHKFDPIPQQDYYSIAGIFNNTREGETPLADDNIVAAYHQARKPIYDRHDQIGKTRTKASQEKRSVSAQEQKQIKVWQDEIKEFEAKSPPKFAFAHTIHDTGSNDMHVALRGNLLKKGPLAPRRFLRIVTGEERTHFNDGSGRTQLADAVTDPKNPLTPRVIVNRIWLNHFGRALVRTPNNFGVLGEQPSHPELLDWLAATFVESGWSIKALHRTIMTSATYRCSSTFHQNSFDVDGDNRTIWRMNPRRMAVETWRDSLLAVTGELDTSSGGLSIDSIVDSHRRTLYAKVSRNDPQRSDEFLRLFDFPIPRASSAKRTTNVIPQQFLFMMNSRFMLDRARALADRLQKTKDGQQGRIEQAYNLLYGRQPTERELHTAASYLQSEAPSDGELNRWQQYCQVLLSSNEFMFIR